MSSIKSWISLYLSRYAFQEFRNWKWFIFASRRMSKFVWGEISVRREGLRLENFKNNVSFINVSYLERLVSKREML